MPKRRKPISEESPGGLFPLSISPAPTPTVHLSTSLVPAIYRWPNTWERIRPSADCTVTFATKGSVNAKKPYQYHDSLPNIRLCQKRKTILCRLPLSTRDGAFSLEIRL